MAMQLTASYILPIFGGRIPKGSFIPSLKPGGTILCSNGILCSFPVRRIVVLCDWDGQLASACLHDCQVDLRNSKPRWLRALVEAIN